MKAADIMTHPVLTVAADAPLKAAVEVMLRNHISGVPVVDSAGTMVGILTEGDLLRRAETGTEMRRGRWLEFLLGPGRLAGDYVRAHASKVAKLMSTDVASVGVDTPIADVVRLMERRRVKRVPVMDGSTLVGIIARADLLRALSAAMRETVAAALDDAALRENVLAELEKQSWTPRATVKVDVRGGVVELAGMIFDEREREGLRVLAENVPGVKGVVDRLCWVDPAAGWIIETENDDPSPSSEGPSAGAPLG
jgi:CBS domain-containing protein